MIEKLQQHGHTITIFHRGLTNAQLPAGIERLYGDRRQKQDLRQALGSRSFDAVIDTALYTGAEAQVTVEVLQQRTGHYIFISTGQVYLIRKGLKRPFREEDYDGEVMAAPPQEHESDYRNWLYGFDKREAEDHLMRAWHEHRFPVTSLRAPMIHGERDHYGRILGYVRRMQDGGPILVPQEPGLPLRHVDAEDVATAIAALVASGAGKGRAFNLAQDETVSLEDFLGILAGILALPLRLRKIPRAALEDGKLLPSCSPLSDPWMSELDNSRSKHELGMRYTALSEYLPRIVRHYQRNTQLQPEGYKTRSLELQLPHAMHK
jgi:nucleoside-diphosphate-sugar epimerase